MEEGGAEQGFDLGLKSCRFRSFGSPAAEGGPNHPQKVGQALWVLFSFQQGNQGLGQFQGGDQPFPSAVKEGGQKGGPLERVLDLGQPFLGPCESARIQKDLGINRSIRVGENPEDLLEREGEGDKAFALAEIHKPRMDVPTCGDLEADTHGPGGGWAGLSEQKMAVPFGGGFFGEEGGLEGGSAFGVEPGSGEGAEVFLAGLPQALEELFVGGAPEGLGLEEGSKPFLKGCFAAVLFEEAEDGRSLVVDDGPVIGLGLVQVGEGLINGAGALAAVHAEGRGKGALEEKFPSKGLRVGVLQGLPSGEGGKALLQPEIIKPFHGHQVAEPLMCDFVVDQKAAAQSFERIGLVVEDQSGLTVEDSAGVLHASVGEGGQKDEIEFGEGIGMSEESLLELPGFAVKGKEQRIQARGLLPAVKNPHTILFTDRKGAGREGEKIGGEGRRLPEGQRMAALFSFFSRQPFIGNRRPCLRQIQAENEAPPQVRLIKTGIDPVRVGGDCECVEKTFPFPCVMVEIERRACCRCKRMETQIAEIVPRSQERPREHKVVLTAIQALQLAAIESDFS